MSIGKHMSLPEARKKKDFERFAKEHPSEGDAKLFEKLVKGMTSGDKAQYKEEKQTTKP